MTNNAPTTARLHSKKPPRKSRLRSKENRWGYFFTLPWLIGFVTFFAYPLIYSSRMAFSRVIDPVSYTLQFVGLENFANGLFRDVDFIPLLGESTKNMLIKMPVVVIFSLFIAILLNRNLKLKGLFRVAFFLPVLLGTGIVMNTINGTLVTSAAQEAATAAAQAAADETVQMASNGMLVMLLGRDIAMALDTVLKTVTDVFWMSGIQIVIFLGALQTIPASYYEAAFCDGASEWEKFWKITLPLTMPTILLNAVYTMIDYLSSTDNEVVSYCSQVGFKEMNLGFGSALAWMHFLVSGILILIVFLILRRFTYYADE